MLIEFLDKIYSSLRKRNKVQSLLRFCIRKISNFLLPHYFKISRKDLILPENDIIVSFTTFPQRIDKVWLVLECMLRQDLLPNMIILWLSDNQFPNKEADLPDNLKYYLKNNLLIVKFVTEDLRSHKKYFYTLQKYPKSKIVVIDDDIFYPKTIISDLIKLHDKYPKTICCHRAHKVVFGELGELLPYKKWKKQYYKNEPSFNLFHTSGGGTLYMKEFFDENLFDKEVFKKFCFLADDVWLNLIAQKSGTKTVKSNYFSNLIPIENNSEKLSKRNVSQGGNDQQISAVINYYNLSKNEIFR
ncbi:hypothetical protein HX089_14865 [Myroides odoratimimus]|uniref:hypothetical protein n=1 Tax=Myroides odoratimimus TaxID=76832 RepID=UPI002577CCC2|nr:hypothetical protein [Myroides odoratimimus]MDM1517657.1 hypothetical protein [Myroides odoratimimus]